MAKFLPKLSTVCEPLRCLTDKDAEFDWVESHEKAFQSIKRMLVEAPVLKYFDADKEVTIESDSSEVGLGAVLTQEDSRRGHSQLQRGIMPKLKKNVWQLCSPQSALINIYFVKTL